MRSEASLVSVVLGRPLLYLDSEATSLSRPVRASLLLSHDVRPQECGMAFKMSK